MTQYEPQVPQIKSLQDLTRFVMEELQQIARMSGGVETVVIPVSNAPPTKTVDGHIAYADGTNWNPGSGRGMYRWDSGTSSWHFLG